MSPSLDGGLSINGWNESYEGYFAPDFEIKINGQTLNISKYMVHEVEVECTILSEADTCTFTLSEPGVNLEEEGLVSEWPLSVLKIGAEFNVSIGYADTLHEVFTGLITHVSLSVQSDSSPKFQVRGMDYGVKLMVGRSVSISWLKRKYSQVVQEICGTHGLASDVDDTSIVIPFVLRQDLSETDHQYLQRLAELAGYDFFVTGKKVYFKKPGWNSSNDTLTLYGGQDVVELDVTADLVSQVSEVHVTGWDSNEKEQITDIANSLSNDQGQGKLGKNFLTSSGFKGVVYSTENVSSTGEAKARAEVLFRSSAREFVRGRVKTVGIPEIKPGHHVRFKRLGDSLDQELEIFGVLHKMDDSGYTTQLFFRGTKI